MSPRTRPGIRTTEFYVTLAVITAATVLGAAGRVDGALALGAVTTAGSAYTLSRGLAKSR